ncbi:MAG: thiamine phosphate synthase [Chloroflexota bacterium]
MGVFSSDQLRIIDANLNRIGEGLRVLEEMARLSLNDADLTQQFKDLRHDLVAVDAGLQEKLIAARDAAGDVGADMESPGQKKPHGVPATIVANARRVQESLRVIEELAKAPGSPLETERYRRARFALYTLEKTLLARMLRQDRMARLTGLYVIIDTAVLGGRSHTGATLQAIRGGAKVIQFRDKEGLKGKVMSIAGELKKLCEEHNVLFIVNDDLDIALAVDADGLHVGQDDLPVAVARRLLPIDKILGASVRTVEEAEAAASDGADYLGVGAMYATPSKKEAGVVGPGRIRDIRQKVDLPIVAIGGINKGNLGEVVREGAVAAAVISAVLGTADIEAATRQLVKVIEEAQGE